MGFRDVVGFVGIFNARGVLLLRVRLIIEDFVGSIILSASKLAGWTIRIGNQCRGREFKQYMRCWWGWEFGVRGACGGSWDWERGR